MRKRIMVACVASALAGVCQETPKPAAKPAGHTYVWVKQGAEQQDVILQEVAAFLEKAGHFYLATVEDGGARVRPIKYTFIVDNKLAFATSTKKEMYAQVVANPNVELSRTAEDKSAYLRFKGKAAVCADGAVTARLLEAYPNFKKSFGDDVAVFLVEPEMVGLFPMKKGEPAKTKIYSK